MTPNNLKILAYNILKNLGDDLTKDMNIPELEPCSSCNNEILSSPLKPFTILACGHIYHRHCIDDKILPNVQSVCPSPNCGKGIETEMVNNGPETESSQSSGTSTITRMLGSGLTLNQPNPNNRKRRNDSTLDKPSKRVKKPVNNEDSRILKRLIQEMSTVISRTSDLEEREALQRCSKLCAEKNMFFDLYFQICNAEKLGDDTRFEVIIKYYLFGEELEKSLVQYKHLEEHEARKRVNNEVKDQLPKEISKANIRKKIERARKIYDLFFRISDEKVQRLVYIRRIKTFTASTISKLSAENIEYVAFQVRMNAGSS